MKSYEEIHQELKPVILETGEFMRKEFELFTKHSMEHIAEHHMEYKDKNNPVSYVDKQSENLLTSGCQKILPGSGFIREEGDNIEGENDYRWIIDPLDGTVNFIHGCPVFSISVALQQAETTVLGVVYHIHAEEYFHAIKGQGSYLNDAPIRANGTLALAKSLVATGFPYSDFDRINAYLSVLGAFMEKCHGLRRMGSAAIDLAWCACGRYDGFFETGLAPWDVAAGILLLEEAGGKTSDYKGTDNVVFGREIVASNGNIHDEMLAVIQAGYA